MSDEDHSDARLPLSALTQPMEAGQKAMEHQINLMRSMTGFPSSEGLTGVAGFKTRVQSGGRISLPEAEREALGIEEGDIVQAFVVPVGTDKNKGDESD